MSLSILWGPAQDRFFRGLFCQWLFEVLFTSSLSNASLLVARGSSPFSSIPFDVSQRPDVRRVAGVVLTGHRKRAGGRARNETDVERERVEPRKQVETRGGEGCGGSCVPVAW